MDNHGRDALAKSGWLHMKERLGAGECLPSMQEAQVGSRHGVGFMSSPAENRVRWNALDGGGRGSKVTLGYIAFWS